MNWKEFLGPTRKKVILSFAIFVLLIVFVQIYHRANSPIPPPGEKSYLRISSDSLVLEENPRLINVPYNSKVKLNVELIERGRIVPQDINNVEFRISHPVQRLIPNPESIISVDSEGHAHYNNEGYVFVSAYLKDQTVLPSLEIILAGGNVYGDLDTDNVIAIFPPEYKPEGSEYFFGDMMNNYPSFIKIVNLAYSVTSELYKGFKPYGGNKQILAFLDLPDHCGGNNNPMETAPCCYMNCDDGTPQYNVIIHEMGHNFAQTKAIQQLLYSDNDKINNAGFGECIASMPVQYIAAKIWENPKMFDLSKESWEYKFYKNFSIEDIDKNKESRKNFEQKIREGEIKGIFDHNLDKVDTFCQLFIPTAANVDGLGNKFGWDFYRRFLNIFEDKELEDFKEKKVESYFAAAYSAAIGKDVREKLKFWGFTVDDRYFKKIYPQLLEKLEIDFEI